MTLHPRLSLHQVAMVEAPTSNFIAHCASLGLRNMTLATPALFRPGEAESVAQACAATGPRVTCVNHLFGVYPDLERDTGTATHELMHAIDVTAELGCNAIYLISGGRGSLDWEAAAARFACLIAPCRDYGVQRGVRLLVENASAMNVDIHMAHTLPDAVALAEIAGIGLCVELHACWMEGNLQQNLRRALPHAGLVQVSDYVLGDRSTPCRAVPGDGAIPLERILTDVLEAGYSGLFDLELVGPRIAAEGAVSATARACDYMSKLLDRLGA